MNEYRIRGVEYGVSGAFVVERKEENKWVRVFTFGIYGSGGAKTAAKEAKNALNLLREAENV